MIKQPAASDSINRGYFLDNKMKKQHGNKTAQKGNKNAAKLPHERKPKQQRKAIYIVRSESEFKKLTEWAGDNRLSPYMRETCLFLADNNISLNDLKQFQCTKCQNVDDNRG